MSRRVGFASFERQSRHAENGIHLFVLLPIAYYLPGLSPVYHAFSTLVTLIMNSLTNTENSQPLQNTA